MVELEVPFVMISTNAKAPKKVDLLIKEPIYTLL